MERDIELCNIPNDHLSLAMSKTDRDELDEQLKHLALEAQRHPPKTRERRVALTTLINAILGSGRLYRPSPSRVPPSFYEAYEDIYDEAKQELLLHICQKIHEYDSERGSVISWVNVLMDRRFFNEAIIKFGNGREMHLKMINKRTPEEFKTVEKDEDFISANEPVLSEKLRWLIEQDPDNIFRSTHIEKKPEANFQVLLIKRLSKTSWKEISGETGISIPTLSSFYRRCLKKFAPQVKEYLSQEG